MTFKLPELKFAKDALEPYIDAQTVEIHHGKHHQTYVDNLNKAVEGTKYAEMDIEELIKNLNDLPEELRTPVRNHGGGHYNHAIYWETIGPNGKGKPDGDLAKKIDETFGSFEAFQEKMEEAAKTQFGSGWAWLVVKDGELSIEKSLNQENPITNGKYPILTVDVWEHAYYLKYQNRRPEYVKNWWNIVNWDAVEEKYEAHK